MALGRLIVKVYGVSVADPLEGAEVEIIGENQLLYTDSEGETLAIALNAPDKELSQYEQHEIKPFATYDIKVTKEGMIPAVVTGVEIYPNVISSQEVYLVASDISNQDEIITNIEEPTLWGNYSPDNYAEDIRLQLIEEPSPPSYTVKVLRNPSVPEYIIVHDGVPTNTTASNYYVNFSDYIKNVACSEIYSTWPTETIKANVIAIISFTLNRIYTEWYRNKGYSFTVTSTSTYDQKYTKGRTIFDTISKVVDEIFNQYIKFPGRLEPFLAQYRASDVSSGQLSQWGSKDLGDKGYSANDILKHYYGNNLTIEQASIVTDNPTSFPGYNLKEGSCGEEVQIIQNQLNKIRGSYPAIPIISNANGEFKTSTTEAVKKFQSVFGLTVNGIVDFATWYKISYIFSAISKYADSVTS